MKAQQAQDLSEPAGEVLAMPEAEVVFYRAFFSQPESDQFFSELLKEINWKQEQIKLYGRTIAVPRLTAWHGEVGKSYRYSGIQLDPDPWTPALAAIKQAIERVSQLRFNSVLLNLYRSGADSVAWHSDDEPELGVNPVIGSVSFGETRTFQFRHRKYKALRARIDLPHGSYLLMKGTTQHCWQHQVPKAPGMRGQRLNLTFRVIH